MQAELRELEPFWRRLHARVEDLARARQRYAEFFQFAPAACFLTDQQGVIREVNQAAAELLGRTGSLLAGKPLVALVVQGRQREFLNRFQNGAASWTSALRTCDGAIEVHVSVSRIRSGLCWTARREP